MVNPKKFYNYNDRTFSQPYHNLFLVEIILIGNCKGKSWNFIFTIRMLSHHKTINFTGNNFIISSYQKVIKITTSFGFIGGGIETREKI